MDTAGKDGVINTVIGMVDPGGISAGVLQEADAGGTRARFPLADREAASPQRVSSGSSTARSTRTCWSSGCTIWCRPMSGRVATRRSTSSSNGSTDNQVTIVKCFLHISRDVQSERLLARLDDPTKYWKYNPGDVDERGFWDSYQQAYSAAIGRCNTAGGAVARHPVRPEVVSELGHRGAADRGPGEDRSGLPASRPSTSRSRSAGSRKADHRLDRDGVRSDGVRSDPGSGGGPSDGRCGGAPRGGADDAAVTMTRCT